MRISRFAFVWTALLTSAVGVPARAQGTAELEAQEEQAFKQAMALAAGSVVRIETVGGLDRIEEVLTVTGPTTGVVVSADGYLISSAFNFASKPASILVTLPDGRRLPAALVAHDRSKMLTLLKIEAQDLIPAQPAPPGSVHVGQWALALGRTFDDEMPSISVGIVSALHRIWGKALQTDAKISPVNYGGPLIDVQGRVLGILVPLSPQASGEVAGVEWYDSGIGFAIPLTDVYAALDRLKTGKDLLPGLLGVTVKSQSQYEGQPALDRVRYGSPAQQAGFKAGDEVIEIDGTKIVRQAQLRHLLGNKYAGDTLTMTVKRGEETLRKELTLVGELRPYESAFLGILPERPDPAKPEAAGVAIRFVYPDSPASRAGLKPGDRVLKFQGSEAPNAAALTDLISRVRPGEKVMLTVQSGEMQREIEASLESMPDVVPADLRRVFIPPAEKPAEAEKAPKTGRFTETLAAYEHDYWAYVPDDYNPAFKYALMVWVHPPGDTMEAALFKAWKNHCDERGIILLAPKAKQIGGWAANEQEFVKDLVDQFLTKYSIDRSRVLVHSFAKGSPFASTLVFKYRELFRGLAMAAAPFSVQPPDNEPDFRLQMFVIYGQKDPQFANVQASAKVIQKMKYPLILRLLKSGDQKYPGEGPLEELVRWIDSLDRI